MPARYTVTKRSGTHNWQLRFYIPVDLQRACGRAEIIRSLKTTDKRLADERALDVVKELTNEIRAAQTQLKTPQQRNIAEPSHTEIEAAVREVYEAEVESDREERIDGAHMKLMGLGGKKSAKAYRAEAKRLRMAAATGDFSVSNVEYWSEHFGFQFLPSSVKKNHFRQQLAYAYAEAAERWAEHDLGDMSGVPKQKTLIRVPEAPSASSSLVEVALPVISGSDHSSLADLWATHERQRGAAVRSATLVDRRVSVGLFADYLGHRKSVADITKHDAREWRDLLYRFPTKSSQRKEFEGQSFVEIIKANEVFNYPAISARTVSKHLSALNTFFRWLVDEGLASQNVFVGLAPHISRRGKLAGQFSDAQLKRLFGSPLFTGCVGGADIRGYSREGSTMIRDWRFWLPLMSAFSGARLGELAQLHVADVREQDGIQYIDINDHGEDGKSTKSEWSNRIVPIHSEVIKLGFLNFVGAQKSQGSPRLFPDIERSSRGHFDHASKWFAKYFKQMNFEPDTRGFLPKFHSFRHSAIERMSHTLGDHEIRPLVGHEERTTTKGYRETHTYSLTLRKQYIELIIYSGLDLKRIQRFDKTSV